jgi:hypothetical protein
MKAPILLLLSTVGFGLLSSSASMAAPASGVEISTAASADHLAQEVRWWGHGGGWGGHWGGGWGYRRGWGPGWGARGWGGPGWCYYHPYRCGGW